jgi:hypothetical protein
MNHHSTIFLTVTTLALAGCALISSDDAGGNQASVSDPGDAQPPTPRPTTSPPTGHLGYQVIASGLTPGGAAWMRIRSVPQPMTGHAWSCDLESPGVWFCIASA